MQKSRKNGKSETARPAVEWIVGVLSCIAVAILIGFLFHQALFRDARPPDLSVVVEAVERTRNGTLVRIAVRNGGDEAAAAVVVRIAGANDGIGGSEIEFDYVAGHAVRRGTFVFAGTGLAPEDIEAAVSGFVEP